VEDLPVTLRMFEWAGNLNFVKDSKLHQRPDLRNRALRAFGPGHAILATSGTQNHPVKITRNSAEFLVSSAYVGSGKDSPSPRISSNSFRSLVATKHGRCQARFDRNLKFLTTLQTSFGPGGLATRPSHPMVQRPADREPRCARSFASLHHPFVATD
jgi:hypothetical protein